MNDTLKFNDTSAQVPPDFQKNDSTSKLKKMRWGTNENIRTEVIERS